MPVLTPEEALNKARVLGTVEGKVTRFIDSKDGKRWGFELAETIKAVSGASWERAWTVWSNDSNISIDSHLIITGDISFKYEEYEAKDMEGNPTGQMKAVVKPSINNPHIKPAFIEKAPAQEMPF
jgi:hypothetical protein